ncbi:hypothetical protein FACS189430_08800 [Bacteroidia bacterium]|nr:hypothetical protein FACS189430_08800 [Bacteroidia bacterium]
MKIKFLNNQSWNEVSREERFFCAKLYSQMELDVVPMLDLLGINKDKQFDIGYEVCFYRDVLKAHGKRVSQTRLPSKRTFDLMLISDDELHIIEAKAQQRFDGVQFENIDNDKEHINALFEKIGQNKPEVQIHALISSNYHPKPTTKSHFNGEPIFWKDVAEKYTAAKEIFMRADKIYEKARKP